MVRTLAVTASSAPGEPIEPALALSVTLPFVAPCSAIREPPDAETVRLPPTLMTRSLPPVATILPGPISRLLSSLIVRTWFGPLIAMSMIGSNASSVVTLVLIVLVLSTETISTLPVI